MARWKESASGFERIDKDAGIIYGVRVIGTQSRNRREYPADVLKANQGKYEESRVYIDHKRDKGERSIRDKWGQLREIRVGKEGGLEADLHYNRAHPMTPQLIEDAERFPKSFGLSHTASGEEEKRGGRNVVTSIEEVFSVDLVSTPATTNGLFESENDMGTTVGKLLEQHAKKVKFAAALLEGLKLFKEEGEDGAMDPMAAPMDAPADGMSPEDQVDAAFKAAVMAVLDDETLDAAGRMAKIKAILQAQEKAETALSGEAPGSGSDGSTSGPGGGEEEPPMSEALRSLQAQVATLTEENQRHKTREACTKLLSESDRTVTDVRLAALARTPEADRKALIESWPKDAKAAATAGNGQRPKASPSVITEETDPAIEYPKDTKSFMESLR